MDMDVQVSMIRHLMKEAERNFLKCIAEGNTVNLNQVTMTWVSNGGTISCQKAGPCDTSNSMPDPQYSPGVVIPE